MISSGQSKALAVISLLCLLGVSLAGDRSSEKRLELEKELAESQASVQKTALIDLVSVPEDTTQRFTVKELKVSGNSLISTTELLKKLPEAYVVSVKKDDELIKEIYDFHVLIDLFKEPGRERDVSLKTLQGLTRYILSVYQERGYAGIYVYVPAEAVQDAKFIDAVLPVKVLEGKIAQISVERYDFDRNRQEQGFLKTSVIESWSPTSEGDVLHKKELDNFVKLLNLNPDRYVSPVVSRSTDPNALNLTYDVYEINPWHLYIQVDNSGTRDRQWSPRVGVINTNLLGFDDRFSAMYQAPWEKGIEEEYAVFGSYDFPVLTPRLRLNLYSGYSQFDVPAAGINFLGNGSFYGSILSYNFLQIGDWFADLTSSMSYERSKVTPSLGVASDVDMELWSIGVRVHRSNDMSNTSLTFNRSENIGGSNKNSFENARLDTDPDFTIYNFMAVHSQYLDSAKVNRISGSFRSVTSDERLIPAKMTTFGGLYTVRGYEEDEIVADGGILISGQYEFDIMKYNSGQNNRQDKAEQGELEKPLVRRLAPLVFFDLGRAKTKKPLPGEQAVRELCSVGTGIIVDVGDDFNAGIYYGWALRGTDETDRGEGRLNMSFIKRF